MKLQECDGNEQFFHRLPGLLCGHRPSPADQHCSHVLWALHCHPGSRWRLQCESYQVKLSQNNEIDTQIFVIGGARKFGVRQLSWDNKQEKEEPFDWKQRAQPDQVPVLQQPNQPQAGRKLQNVKSLFCGFQVFFSAIALCMTQHEIVYCGLVVGRIKGRVSNWPFRFKGIVQFLLYNHTTKILISVTYYAVQSWVAIMKINKKILKNFICL